MASRSGSFGGSLNPFGGGSLSSFGAYDIGSNLAELDVYKIEVAWGNGTATDEEYLAALTKAVTATDPNTRNRESAQNRLDDAVYRIDRSKAQAKGLDELIAFDQSAIAKMSPDNLRYRSVKDALDSELAQRRSRDYGDLVREYNDGKVSTEQLAAWVAKAITGLDSEDSDYQHWVDAQGDLEDRVKTEKDQEVYQEYQQGRMKPDAFLAYLTNRRDAFEPMSPQYDDWGRRLEDAQKQVKNDALAKQDGSFFNAYEQGKKSDKQYLTYLSDRIDGMDADDSQLGAWKHRLTQAAFSIAEDTLRFDVQTGKQPTSKLVTFYKNYQRTLNKGSAEYRTIARALLSLGSGASGGGGGGRARGGGGGTKTKGSGVGGAQGWAPGSPKLINPTYTLDNIMPLLTINANSSPKELGAATKALNLNVTRAENALTAGDKIWLFQDPRKPGQLIPGQNPDGSPMLGPDGKQIMVPGSAYLETTSQALSNLFGLQTDLHYQLAAKALASNDAKGYFYQLGIASNSEDRQRRTDAQFIQRSNQDFYKLAQDGIDLAMKTGDWATAVNLAMAVQDRLTGDMANPMLDDSRRASLERISDKLSASKLLPQVDPFTGQRVGGAMDLENSTRKDGQFTSVSLLPGWHHILDSTNDRGVADWGLDYDEVGDPALWDSQHVTVHTTYGNQVVTGEVTLRYASSPVAVVSNVADGAIRTDYTPRQISYTDEHGRQMKAYSIDGKTWIRSMTGVPPVIQLSVALVKSGVAGSEVYLDPATGEVVYTQLGDGSWATSTDYFDKNPQAADWYGMGDLRKRQATLGKVQTIKSDGTLRQGQFVSGYEEQYLLGAGRSPVRALGGLVGGNGGFSVGAEGQSMQIVTMSDTGELNLTSRGYQARDDGSRGAVAMKEARSEFLDQKYQTPTMKEPRREFLENRLTAGQNPARPASPTAQQRADRYGENVADLYQPSIRQQLPVNTPQIFDGVGFTKQVTPPQLTLGRLPPPPPAPTKTAVLYPLKTPPKPAPKPAPRPTATRTSISRAY